MSGGKLPSPVPQAFHGTRNVGTLFFSKKKILVGLRGVRNSKASHTIGHNYILLEVPQNTTWEAVVELDH